MPRLKKNGSKPLTRKQLQAEAVVSRKCAEESLRRFNQAVFERDPVAADAAVVDYAVDLGSALINELDALSMRAGRPSYSKTVGIIKTAMQTTPANPPGPSRSIGRPRRDAARDIWVFKEVERHRDMLRKTNASKGTILEGLEAFLSEGAAILGHRRLQWVNARNIKYFNSRYINGRRLLTAVH